MKLTPVDRILIGQLMPKETDLITQSLIRDILKKIDLSTEEAEKYGVRIDGEKNEEGKIINPNIFWNKLAMEEESDFEISKTELSVLKNAVEEVDKAKKVTQIILDTCLKIKEHKAE